MTLRAIPIDQFFAEVEETRERRYGPANPNDEKFLRRISREEEERRKAMAEKVCKEPGCDNPKYKSNALCYEHLRERQRAKAGSAREAAPPEPKAVEVPVVETVDREERATLLSAYEAAQARQRDIFIERQNQHGSMSINECGLDDLSGVLKLKAARVKQQVRAVVIDENVLLDSLDDLANYCTIMELKHTGEWNFPWEVA